MKTNELVLQRLFFDKIKKRCYTLGEARLFIFWKFGYRIPYNRAVELAKQAKIILDKEMEVFI
jgi:hypothetical protein